MLQMSILDSLMRHVAADGLEAHHLRQMIAFAGTHDDPFDRSIAEGHFTGSAVVVSSDGERVLLVFHRKLQCWLQPGGHADPGETAGEEVALREAREETGIEALALHPDAPRPLDVDIHRIPQRGDTPAHDHLDLRYLVVAAPGSEASPCTVETRGARWIGWNDVGGLRPDLPMRRMLEKARRWVQASPEAGL
jgi:8-oxo-dGTP pyrophosphatase MutT (NUDIX family)